MCKYIKNYWLMIASITCLATSIMGTILTLAR